MSDPHEPVPDDPARRRFMNICTNAVGATLTAAVAVPPLVMVATPLFEGGDEEGDDGKPGTWARVAPIGRFPEDGSAVRVVIKQDETDKWLTRRNVPVGSVLIRRKGPEDFLVLSAKCPHLGCSVKPNADDRGFTCPCHQSTFGPDGSLKPHADGSPNPAPRALDELEWRVRSGALVVRWVNYKPGTEAQVPIG